MINRHGQNLFCPFFISEEVIDICVYLKEIQKISLFIPQQEEVLGTVLKINGYIYFLPII